MRQWSQRVIRRESKIASSFNDQLFLACVAFCVITFEPIMIQTCSAPQNDRLNFSFVKGIKVVVEKMTRNHRKMATYYSASFSKESAVFLISHLLVFDLWQVHTHFILHTIHLSSLKNYLKVTLSLKQIKTSLILTKTEQKTLS